MKTISVSGVRYPAKQLLELFSDENMAKNVNQRGNEMRNSVVINGCYGGFGLSQEALRLLRERGVEIEEEQEENKYYNKGHLYDPRLPRHDPRLIAVVEELGERADGEYAALYIETIPGNRYRIEEYDGSEVIRCPEDDDWVVIE